MTPAVNPLVKVALGAGALVFLIVATQVAMPLRAILLAVAVSDLIFLLILQVGPSIPGKKQDD